MSRRNKQRSIFHKVIRKILRYIYFSSVHDLGILDLNHFDSKKMYASASLNCVRLNDQNFHEIRKCFSEKFSDKYLNLKDQATCIVAFDQDTPVGYTWYTHQIKEGEGTKPFLYTIRPKKNCVYIFDAFVLPHERHFYYLKSFFRVFLCYIQEDGYQEAITTISERTPGVKILLSKFGFQFVDQLRYRKILFFVKQDISALDKVCQPLQRS